jgi:hypothetical protein
LRVLRAMGLAGRGRTGWTLPGARAGAGQRADGGASELAAVLGQGLAVGGVAFQGQLGFALRQRLDAWPGPPTPAGKNGRQRGKQSMPYRKEGKGGGGHFAIVNPHSTNQNDKQPGPPSDIGVKDKDHC